ncbi:LysE family transporter, partial [Pseudomonas aeruginosa]
PKAILFFVSFVIQFVDPGYADPGLSFLLRAVILELVSALYLGFLVFTGVRLAACCRRQQRLAACATSGGAALLGGCGEKLATYCNESPMPKRT